MAKLIILLFSLHILNVYSATFENIKVRLSQQKFVSGVGQVFDRTVPDVTVTLQSDDNLSRYINGKNLKNVYIDNENIPELPADSVNITDVVQLSITCSQLKYIEPGAFNIENELHFLNLSYNELETIENDVFPDQIEVLIIDHNQISNIGDKTFNNMKVLGALSLMYNKITVWNTQWFVGSSIPFLMFDFNKLKELPENALVYSDNTVTPVLQFKGNLITKVSPGAVKGVTKISHLDLAENQLETLDTDIFKGIDTVTRIYLRDNRISKIDENVFKNISSDNISLVKNKLQCIPKEYKGHGRIGYVHVEENPISCTCFNFWKNARKPQLTFDFEIQRSCRK